METLKSEEKKNRQLILVIDDLDRIDPEHIFRILNVFSSHMNFIGESPKFIFDKTILIGDIENLRNIFHSKYGSNTDFSGYIDKFYSNSIYHFDNKESLKANLVSFISKINYPKSIDPEIFKDGNLFFTALMNILFEMINARALNVRSLINVTRMEIEEFPTIYFKGYPIQVKNFPFITILILVERISGGYKEFIDNLTKTKIKHEFDYLNYDKDDIKFLYGNLAMILNNGFQSTTSREGHYESNNYQLKIDYKIERRGYERFAMATQIKYPQIESPIPIANIPENKSFLEVEDILKYNLLIDAAKHIQSMR